jgi:hypothetical protein
MKLEWFYESSKALFDDKVYSNIDVFTNQVFYSIYSEMFFSRFFLISSSLKASSFSI